MSKKRENIKIIEWKWTFGPNYQKSARINSHNQNETISESNQVAENMPNLAIQQSMLSENDYWSLEEQQVFIKMDKPLNKREDTYSKMATREMVGQIGMNPFSNNNYLTDVIAQDNFLKPISTSLEKENK